MTSVISLGSSVKGVPLVAEFLGSSGPFLHLYSGIHGDEPEAEEFLTLFWQKSVKKIKTIGTNIIYFPRINPDGLLAGTRVNANGVDLNRNFPSKNWTSKSEEKKNHPGKIPASEPETKAIISLISKYKPLAIISIHTWIQQVNYDGPAGELAKVISEKNRYNVTENIGYPTPGSLGAYAGHDRNIPVITLELPEHTAVAEYWEKNCEALISAMKYLGKHE